MKAKTILSVLVALFFIGTAFSQSNHTNPATNFYESLYGTVTASRGAMDALVFVDYTVGGNDGVVDGLINHGYTVTVATDWTDFNTKLASGNYGLAVAFNQDATNGLSYAATEAYIANGGCMIYTDWTLDNALAALFEANWTGGVNQSPVNLTEPLLMPGVTNPVVLTNYGWGIYSMDLVPVGAGEALGYFPTGVPAIVRGNGGKTIILGYLSDTPPPAERQQLFENVVSATLCGGAPGVPLSDWAIFLGLFLIAAFVVVRFVKTT